MKPEKKGGPRKRTERRRDKIGGYAGSWEPCLRKRRQLGQRRVLSRVSEDVKRAMHTGDAVRVTYVIQSVDQEPQIQIEEIARGPKDDLHKAMDTAKQRAAERVAEILKVPESYLRINSQINGNLLVH